MKPSSVVLMSVAALTGLAGAGVAYEIAAPDEASGETSVVDTTPAAPAEPRRRWAPCEPPAVREERFCVSDAVRTVVLPAPAGAATSVRRAGGAGLSGHDGGDDHGGDRDDPFGHDDGALDDHSGHGGDSDDDDDGRDDDGRDDDGRDDDAWDDDRDHDDHHDDWDDDDWDDHDRDHDDSDDDGDDDDRDD